MFQKLTTCLFDNSFVYNMGLVGGSVGLTSVVVLKVKESAGYSLQNQNGAIIETVYVLEG